ncbi:MAG: nucleoside deaminase [Bacteroidetes bacterium]|nr:MAG: nucleoside deaminase [Bacteroidota bacterium]
MEDHAKFLKEAIRMARENVPSGKGGPFGALVVKNGEIIGRGVNQVTSTNDPTAHAEVMAIRDACKNIGDFQLNDCIIYASCEPCPMCLGAIYWARPKMIVFAAENTDASQAGFDDSYIYKEISAPISQRKIPTLNLKPDNFFSPFQLWMDMEMKRPY